MILQVKYFGMIAEAIGKSQEQIEIECSSVGEFTQYILSKYPKLNNYNYKIAVNQNIVDDEFALSGNVEIALLPPFAGG